MDEKVEWLRSQLEEWKRNKIVDDETAGRINNYYLQKESKNNEAVLNVLKTDLNSTFGSQKNDKVNKSKISANSFVVPLVLSIISAVLIGAGIISLIAYNWASISRVSKTIWAFIIAFVPVVLLIPSAFKPEKEGFLHKKVTKELLACLWVILAGGAIEFLCQIYLLQMSWTTVFLLWFIISLLVFISTKSYGAHGLITILLAAYCISTKQIFPFIPVASLVLWYGLKQKKEIFTVTSGLLLSIIAVSLCVPEMWINKAPVSATLIFYLFTALAVVLPVYDAIKTKKITVYLSTVIFPIVTGIFYIPYNLCLMETEAVNGAVVILITVLIYTLLFSIFIKEQIVVVCLPILLLLVCAAAFNYMALSILICVFMIYSVLVWRESKYSNRYSLFTNSIILSLLAFGYFLMQFQGNEEVYICRLTNTSQPVLQLIVMCIMGLTGLIFTVLSFVHKIKNKHSLISFCEILFISFSLFGLMLYGYFGKIDVEFFQSVIQICLITLMMYGTVKIVYYKQYIWSSFIVAEILSLVLSNLAVVETNGLYGPYWILVLSSLGMFVQNKGRCASLCVFGKVLFGIALFTGIFEVYEISYSYYYMNQLSSLNYLSYNLSIFYVFAFCVLRPVLISIRHKKFINYAMPVYALLIIVLMLVAQFRFSEDLPLDLNFILPIVSLIFVVVFSIIEIITWFKKESIAGVNVSAIYLLFVAFIKFFMSTNDLIARGLAFIFCGILVLVTNLILSNYLKAKGEKNEK